MEPSDKSPARTRSSGTSVQLPESERTLTTLILDVLERLTILEQTFKFADAQRTEISQKVTALAKVSVVKKDIEEMVKLVKEHENFFKEFQFGLKVARAGWATLYMAGGGIFGAGIQWFLHAH